MKTFLIKKQAERNFLVGCDASELRKVLHRSQNNQVRLSGPNVDGNYTHAGFIAFSSLISRRVSEPEELWLRMWDDKMADVDIFRKICKV
jgi:hypothetical protein